MDGQPEDDEQETPSAEGAQGDERATPAAMTGADRPLLGAAIAAQVQAQLARTTRGALSRAELTRALANSISSIAARQADWDATLGRSLAKLTESISSNWLDHWANASLALTRASDYRDPDPAKGPYTDAMTSPGAYFARDEVVVDSIEALNTRIVALVERTTGLPLVWRGVRNADWSIHSHLFRHLCGVNGVKPPQKRPKHPQPYPDEDQMVRAEREILRVARTDWRFDGLSALETFARIQHAGGPTRLLDVTKNPYIAAWFAVEQNNDTDGEDARLIAFATRPVAKDGKPTPGDSVVQLDAEWSDRTPPWHLWTDAAARQGVDWGTGARRRVWVPPAYDPRILAQNAAFLLDGVPITSAKTASYFRSSAPGDPARYWSRADLLAASSVYARTASPARKPRYNAPNLAPTFTFRITADAKPKIRQFLEAQFGYTRSYVYPDIAALAAHLNEAPLAELA